MTRREIQNTEPPVKRLINIVATLVIITVTYLIYAKISVKPPKPKMKVESKGIPVRTLKVKSSSHSMQTTLWGEVKYRHRIALKGEVEGKVLKVNDKLRPGYLVKQGEVLVEIDSERLKQRKAELQANLLSNQAELSQLNIEKKTLESEIKLAAANVSLSKEDVERHERLVFNNNASKLTLSNFKQLYIRSQATQQQLQSRLALNPQKVAASEAKIKSVLASISIIDKDIRDSIVKAPFSAKILGSVISAGDYLKKGELICDLVDPQWFEIWINIGVREKQALGHIKELQFMGKSFKDYRLLGELEKKIQADYLIFEIKGEALKAGELVEVGVIGRDMKDVITLPESALRNDRKSVYLAIDGKLKIQPVVNELTAQGRAYISSGLELGQEVIVTRLNDLPEGTKVNPGQDN